MSRTLGALHISTLEKCVQHLNVKDLSQLALVSKGVHLATRSSRTNPKHLDCTSLELEDLEKRLNHITLLAQETEGNRLLPPLGALTYCLYEQPTAKYRHYEEALESEMMAKQAAKTDKVIQILESNKGVPVFVLDVRLSNFEPDKHDVARKAALISTIGRLADAAYCKNGVVELLIEDRRSYTRSPADATVAAILAQFANRSAIVSVTLTAAYMNDVTQTLKDGLAAKSLKTLVLNACSGPTENAPESRVLAGLEHLSIRCGYVPPGIIQSNAASLRTLVIHRPIFRHGWDTRPEGVSLVPPFQAHFPNLSEFTLEVQEDAWRQTAIMHMFLFSEDITMPAVRHLKTFDYDALKSDDNITCAIKRFPSLKKWTLREWYKPLFAEYGASIEAAGSQPSVYGAVARGCEEHHVRLEIISSLERCGDRTALATELQRVKLLQNHLHHYELNLSVQALEKPFHLSDPLSLPEMRAMCVQSNSLSLDEWTGEEAWADNLVGMLQQMPAPKCKEVKISFEFREALLDAATRFLEGLVFLPSFPNLERITGILRVGNEHDVQSDHAEKIEDSVVHKLRATLTDLNKKCWIDLTDLKVVAV